MPGSVRPLSAQAGIDRRPAPEFTFGLSFHDVSGRLGNAAAVELGYHPAWRVFGAISPDAGAMVAWDGALFGFVGIRVPLRLGSTHSLTPSFGVGAFGAGSSSDLGSVLEFRSGITVTLDLAEDRPVGVSFYHLSNAGLSHPNPGMEVVEVSYTVSW